MKHIINEDLVDRIYNEHLDFLEDKNLLAKDVIEIELSLIKPSSLVESYKSDNDKQEKIEGFKHLLKNGLPMGPLVVDLNYNLLDGNHRFVACQELKIKTVFCLIQKNIDPLDSSLKYK